MSPETSIHEYIKALKIFISINLNLHLIAIKFVDHLVYLFVFLPVEISLYP